MVWLGDGPQHLEEFIIQNLKAVGSFPTSTTEKPYSLRQLLPPPQCLMLPISGPVTGLPPSLPYFGTSLMTGHRTVQPWC